MLRYLNLSLLILFPVAWFAPLLRAGLLPLFSLSEISVISGLQSLWGTDVFLALIVTAFALFAPYLKTIGLALVQFRLLIRVWILRPLESLRARRRHTLKCLCHFP